MKAFFLLILMLPSVVFSQAEKSKAADRLRKYIDPDNSLTGFYALSDSGLTMYANPTDKAKNKAEFFLRWKDTNAFEEYWKSTPLDSIANMYATGKFRSNVVKKNSAFPVYGKPLDGIKIAIDPGHIAGDSATARMEGKCLFLERDSAGIKTKLEIIEGQLTLATARILKQKLELDGAIVMMTREQPNQSAFGITYEQWLKQEGLPTAGKRKIFHDKFKNIELIERSKKINAFKPDLTMIIHYNVDETNEGWTKPVNKNFTMAFIGGNVKSRNLATKNNRMELLRMIATSDLDNSEKLAGALVDNFVKDLKIRAASINDAKYLKEESIAAPSKGVFSRNLALTRLVHGPLAYGESLYQDNFNECVSLCDCTIDVQGLKTSKRVEEVAGCYYKAVLEYFRK